MTVTPGTGLVFADQSSILADGISQTTVTATVIDSLGQPLPGALVTFVATSGTITPQSYSNDNGQASAVIVSAPSTTDISSSVTASSVAFAKIAKVAESDNGETDTVHPGIDSAEKPAKSAGTIGTTSIIFRGISVSGSIGKSTVFANGADSTLVTVEVKETTSGVPLEGISLAFSATAGQLRATVGTTDSNGRIELVFFGGNVSGSPVITATLAEGLRYSAEISLIKQLFMNLESNPSVLSANGTDVSTIKAYLFDADNNPIKGETVYFKTTHGRIISSATTDDWGEATVNLRSARYNGEAQVTASFSTISKSTYVKFTGAEMNLSAVPLILVADGKTRTRLAATLLDASNLAIVDETVTVTTSLGTLVSEDGVSTGVTIADSTSTEGRITTYLTSDVSGTALVIFEATGLRDSLEVDFTDYSFTVSASDTEILAGGSQTTITATLLDKDGTIIDINAADVEFSPTLGTVSDIVGNDDGSVSAILTSGANAGPATVTAAISDPPVSTSTIVTFVAAKTGSISLESSKSFVRIGGNSIDIIATVYDETGNPKSDETVTFTIVKGPGGGESLDSGTAVTNDIGQAIVSFVSGMTGSTQNGVQIQARVASITDTTTITITGQPETVVVGFDTDNYVTNSDGTIGLMVSSIVSDVNRNKVADGTYVSFSIIGDVGVIDNEVPTVGGVASAMLIYSSSDAGKTIQVTASSGGKQDIKEVILPGTTGTVAVISATTSDLEVPADGESTAHITISVSGTEGEPIDNLTIHCSADIGLIPPTALTGDPNNPEASPGEAYITYTSLASREDRVATITMSAGTVTKTMTIQLRGISLQSTADPEMLPSDGQSNSLISVLVKETTTHIPLVSQTVRFGATDGTIDASAITDESGVATTTFTAGYNSGVTSIYITYGKTLIDTVYVTISEVTARGIDLFANPTQIAANGISTSTITALLRDDNFNPVVNEIIRFTTTLGTISAADTTDESGRAEVILESERRNGQALVTATFKEHVKSIPVDFTGVSLSINATPENLFAGGGQETEITAYLKDAAEVPIVGEDVVFTWFMDGAETGQFTAETDVQGKSSITLSSDDSGIAKIIVKGAGAVDSTQVEFTQIRFIINGEAESFSTGGDSLNVWVELYDTVNERYIENATVNFYTTIGSITETDVTDDQGRAEALLTSGLTAGIATVSASVVVAESRVSAEHQFTIVNASPANVSLSVDANIVSIGGSTSALIAVVTDSYGNPVSDVLVSFQVLSGPAGGEYIKPPTATTGSSGTARTYFYSGQIPSDYEGVVLKAHVKNIESNTASLTIAGAPETIRPSFNTDWSLDDINNGNGTYTLPISATVLDINSNGVVDGTTVYFKIEPAEGAVSSPVKTVNSVAVSSITYPSASAGKEVLLTASAGGKEGSITFTLPGFAVSYMTLTANPKTILADGKSTSEIKATLFDSNGSSANVPDGTTVSFSTDGGTLDPIVVRTEKGIAVTTLTSDKTALRYVFIEAQAGLYQADTYVYFDEIGNSVNQVGDIAITAYDEDGKDNPTIEADGISSVKVVAYLTKYDGTPVTTPTTVAFESDIGQITSFVRSDSLGYATASFSSGQVGTATISATVGNVLGYTSVVISPGLPRSVELSVSSTSVNVRGAGINESLVITASVMDSKGNPVADGNLVRFRLVGSYDTESSLSPEGDNSWESTELPTLNGYATVSFHSGIRAGTVRVEAIVLDSEHVPVVTSETTQFKVYGGPAYLDMTNVNDPFTESRMKLYTGPSNIYANEIGTDYNQSTVTVTVADRYNNPVPPGTAVYFTTTGGYITNATGYTDENGMATVTLFSANPFPTIDNSSTIPNPNYGTQYPGSPVNFNVYSWDFDGNGLYNDGIAVITAETEGMDHNGNNVTVWNYTQVIFSTNVSVFRVVGDTTSLNIGEVAQITITIHDYNGNPVVKDSELTIATTDGALSTSSITTGDPGQVTFTTTLTNDLDPLVDSPGNAVISVSLDSPNGVHTAQIENPIYLTISQP